MDDGSTDRTRDILSILSSLNTDIQFVSLSRNFGNEAALAAEMARATGDAVVPIDVDLQDPPELILPMVKLWLGGGQNLLSLGIMGEYLGRVAREGRNRPLYIVADEGRPVDRKTRHTKPNG
ncbi:glycosyltransferase [Sphingobium subterraneum]|uniref:Glycosyltransferase involved in cell wall biosynthesis n=1 Tax=Sphingobium subterraneum TaxID=627688 RepID=A0A841IY30_9SPHN|nr:glycosyltransferase involved in cell wall biosynthesis [Sphingobium subterraneum]